MMANASVFPTYAMNTIVAVECAFFSCFRIPAHAFQIELDGTIKSTGGSGSVSVSP